MVGMCLDGKHKRYGKQQQRQQKIFVSYYKINNLLHDLYPYFIKTLLYLTKFLSVMPVPRTTALKGSSAI